VSPLDSAKYGFGAVTRGQVEAPSATGEEEGR
jgi:hypothetical protein